MVRFENKMLDIIEALHKSGLLKDCIISGSWAMFFLKKYLKVLFLLLPQRTLIFFFQMFQELKKAILINY